MYVWVYWAQCEICHTFYLWCGLWSKLSGNTASLWYRNNILSVSGLPMFYLSNCRLHSFPTNYYNSTSIFWQEFVLQVTEPSWAWFSRSSVIRLQLLFQFLYIPSYWPTLSFPKVPFTIVFLSLFCTLV